MESESEVQAGDIKPTPKTAPVMMSAADWDDGEAT